MIPAKRDDEWELQFVEGDLQGIVTLCHAALAPGTETLSPEFRTDDTLQEPFLLPTGETAWTRIAWGIEFRRLHLATIHTYPEEGAVIRSYTSLYLQD